MAYHNKEVYPRPDFVHAKQNWHPVNDGWTILYDDEDVGLTEGWQVSGVPDKVAISPAAVAAAEELEAQRLAAFPELKEKGFGAQRPARTENLKRAINVPFVFQTPASGVHDNEAHEVLWYERRGFADPRAPEERSVAAPAATAAKRVLLRFGAVDYEATLWASGQLVGSHRGGHVPFDLDLTEALDAAWRNGANGVVSLVLRVRDSPYDLAQPRGKQYWGPQPEVSGTFGASFFRLVYSRAAASL